MPGNAIDLTNVAAVEQYGTIITGTVTDAIIQALITAASSFFYKMTGLAKTAFAATSYTDFYNGPQEGHTLMLRNSPITAVASVTINGVAIPASSDGIQAGFVFDDVQVYLIGYHFCGGFQNVKVGYTAGLTAVPPEVELNVRDWVLLSYRQIKNKGERSTTIQGSTAAHDLSPVPPMMQKVIDTYNDKFPNLS